MHRLKVNHNRGSYDIVIDEGAVKVLPTLLDQYGIKGRIALITDSTVNSLYGKGVLASLRRAEREAELFSFPEGEKSKSLKTVSKLYDSLLEKKFERNDVILALGGGVVGDIAGFTASTLFRGMKVIQVPTTLLAQVDSSVGGKTGVNHSEGKNLIGSFYQPELVIIDPDVLSTLQTRDMISGLGEVIKCALIGDPKLFVYLEDNLNCLLVHHPSETIATCCRIKASFVEKDEFDKECRMMLNFGHTVGHGLESLTKYEHFRHGEAVIYGMKAAAYISNKLGHLPVEHFNRIVKLLKNISLPPLPEEITVEKLFEAMKRDKKSKDGKTVFIGLKSIGKPFVIDDLERDVLFEGINYLLKDDPDLD